MRALRAWCLRVAGLFPRDTTDRDLDEELASHLQLHIDDNLRAGMRPDEARRAAILALGGLAATRERVRDRRRLPFVDALVRDVRYGVRSLRRTPGFALVAVVMLALGIGANAAIFSLVDAVLLRSLPVREPDRLVVLRTVQPRDGVATSFSYPMYQDLRDRAQAFSGVVARGGTQVAFSDGGVTERVVAELVSGNYYDVLGVRPWIGRLLTPDDDRTPGGHPLVVLTYRFWQRRFGGDPSIVGRTVRLNDHPMTVVGVAAPRFYGLELSSAVDVQIPLMETPLFNPVPANRLQSRSHQWLTLMARLAPGVTIEQARESAGALFRRILTEELGASAGTRTAFQRREFLASRLELQPGAAGFGRLQRELRTPLWLLFGATAIVLLILTANLANLLLARAASRRAETAIRTALGASRGRIVQQWLVESLLLAIAGAAGGTAVAAWGRGALVAFLPDAERINLAAPLDWRVLGFLIAAGLATSVLFGLAPAFDASRSRLTPGIAQQSRAVTGGLRGALVAAQVALTIPLLVAALLFARSLARVRGIDLGFASDHVLVASVDPSLNGYTTERARGFYDDLLAALRLDPDVRAAGLATASPISGEWDELRVVVEGYHPRDGEDMSPYAASVSPGYFPALGMPILAGRDFSDRDRLGAPRVAIVNETMARYFFGDANPVGRRIGTGDVADTVIVGVVRDAKYVDVRETPKRHFYEPVAQEPRLFGLTLQVRTAGDPAAAAALVRRTVARIDPHVPVYHVATLDEQIDESLVEARLLTWLAAIFGALATLLAAVGLYGVIAFAVARRTREIGVRMALGAPRWRILLGVTRETFGWVAGGVVLGLAAAAALARIVASELYEVAATDPRVFAAAAAALVAAAAIAAYLPARRATSIDPVAALRAE
jgi:predicted permease